MIASREFIGLKRKAYKGGGSSEEGGSSFLVVTLKRDERRGVRTIFRKEKRARGVVYGGGSHAVRHLPTWLLI